MRIVYMGTPDIAATVLERLLQGPDEVVLAVTQPDRPKNRGKQMQCSAVKEVCMREGIPVFQPEKLREEANRATLENVKPDMIIVVAYGQLLPKWVLDLPRFGCINVHASLLPEYRGAAPIQWAILDGKKKTGITIMYMAEGLDTGDIILQKEIRIAPKETGESLYDKLAALGGEALMEAIPQIVAGTAGRTPQGEMTTAYAKQLKKEMGQIDFTQTAEEIERKIRGLNSWPSAYTYFGGKQLKLWEAELVESGQSDFAPGTVVRVEKDSFSVQTGKGELRVTELQLEGKQKMKTADFLRGNKLVIGDCFDSKEA